MKITQITEATYENISIIENIVDYIIDTMPDVIPENSTFVYGHFPRKGTNSDWLLTPSSSEIKSIKDLLEENKDNPIIKQTLERLMFNQITFHNTEKYLTHTAQGDYSWGPINIYVSRIQKSTRPMVVKHNEDYGYPSAASSRMVRTLFHEIRHFFQDDKYSKYMRSPASVNDQAGSLRPWGERQIEWDAKWSDTLYDTNVSVYSDSKDYAEAVMEEFKRWVTISPNIEQHYYRKTIAYHLNWVRKQLEKQWQKIMKTSEQYVLRGSFSRQELVDDVLEDLTWYVNNGTGVIPPAVKQYFKIKTIKYYEEITKPLKTKNKLNQYIEKYNEEYNQILQNFLDANHNRIADINKFGAASGIVDKLMDNHPDFFYTKNKAMYQISHEVNKHYYKQAVEYIGWLKEIKNKHN